MTASQMRRLAWVKKCLESSASIGLDQKTTDNFLSGWSSKASATFFFKFFRIFHHFALAILPALLPLLLPATTETILNTCSSAIIYYPQGMIWNYLLLTKNKTKENSLCLPAFYHWLSSASCKLTSGSSSHISVRSGSITHGSMAILIFLLQSLQLLPVGDTREIPE